MEALSENAAGFEPVRGKRTKRSEPSATGGSRRFLVLAPAAKLTCLPVQARLRTAAGRQQSSGRCLQRLR